MAQALSIPLQNGIRFFYPPLPAAPSAFLTDCFPKKKWGDYGLTVFRVNNISGLGSASTPTILGGYATPPLKESSPSHCLLAQAYQCFWLVPYHGASNSDSLLLTLPLILAPCPPSTGRYYVFSRFHSASARVHCLGSFTPPRYQERMYR